MKYLQQALLHWDCGLECILLVVYLSMRSGGRISGIFEAGKNQEKY